MHDEAKGWHCEDPPPSRESIEIAALRARVSELEARLLPQVTVAPNYSPVVHTKKCEPNGIALGGNTINLSATSSVATCFGFGNGFHCTRHEQAHSGDYICNEHNDCHRVTRLTYVRWEERGGEPRFASVEESATWTY